MNLEVFQYQKHIRTEFHAKAVPQKESRAQNVSSKLLTWTREQSLFKNAPNLLALKTLILMLLLVHALIDMIS